MRYLPERRSKRYLQCDVWRRNDGLYALDVVLCYADLDMITPDQAKVAIDRHVAWMNPLRWVTVAISHSRDQMFKLMKEIQTTGSVFQGMRNSGMSSSSIDLRMDGGYGRHTLQHGSGELGTSFMTMGG